MKEAGEFQIFCPKAEKFVPQNGTFWVNKEALANGEQIVLDCPYAKPAQPLEEVQFGPIGLRMSVVGGKDLITVRGGANLEKGTVDAQLDCNHCGNHVDLSFPK